MLLNLRSGSQTARYGAIAAFVVFVPFAVLLAILFAGGAPFLSVWVILVAFGVLGAGLFAFAGSPSFRTQRRCFYLLLASVFLTIVWPRYASIHIPGLPALPLARLALFALSLAFLFLLFKSDDFRSRLLAAFHRHAVILYPLLALLLWRLIGVFTSESPFGSFRSVLNEAVSVYLPLFAALGLIQTRRSVHAVLMTFLVATVVVVGVGIYESLVNRNVFYGFFQIDSEYLENSLRDKVRDGAYRVQSTFFHPLVLSEFLVLMVPVATYMAFVDGFRWRRSFMLCALVLLMTYVIYKTGSRSGVGGFAVVLWLTAIMGCLRLALRARDAVMGGFYWLGVVSAVVVGVVAALVALEFLVGATAETRSSGVVRLLMWESGLTRAAERPIMGWGQGLAAQVLGFVIGSGVLTIDSYYLSVLLDAGYPALIFFAFSLAAMIGTFFKHGLSSSESSLLAALMMSGVVAFALIKLVLSLDHNHGLFMVLLGTTLASIEVQRQASPSIAASGASGSLKRAFRGTNHR